MPLESPPASPANVIQLTSITDSKIAKVNLSPGRAEVTRVYKLALEAGPNQVRIAGLPREMHRDSLRVEGRGPATIHDVSIAPTPTPPADPETASALSKELKLITTKIKRCKDVSAFLEKSLLVPAEYAQIAAVVDTYEEQIEGVDDRLFDLEDQLEKMQLRRDVALGRPPRGRAADPLGLTAAIGITAEQGGEAEIALIYAVPNASWEASYDIRVDMQSKDAPFRVRYKAALSQFTGEDWDNVQLTLDTVNPTFGLAVPSLGVYRLSEEYSRPAMQPTLGAYGPTIVAVPGSRSSSRSRSPSPIEVRDRPEPMSHATLPAPNFGGLSTTYDVPGLITVPDNARAHTVTIADLALDADFSWLVVPKVDLRVYLKARVKNVSEYALVAGPANVYIDGSFVAKSRFPAVNPQETFESSLGVDPSVRTTYAPLSKKTASSGLLTKTTTTTYSRQATVRNTKAEAIQNLKILDRIPVSEDAQIVVKLLAPALRPPPLPTSPAPAPSAPKTEKSPSGGSSGGGTVLGKGKGYQFSSLKSFTTSSASASSPSLLNVSEDVVAQWEGAEEGEVGTGSDGKLCWVCTIPPQGKISVELRWEESRPAGMKLVDGAR
ncbi:hypothetical protein EYR38_003433 [Pleurotus pulmonarius]|nr:hypothetical protein EYR38_003433 [Pleurotus pulmonarius]